MGKWILHVSCMEFGEWTEEHTEKIIALQNMYLYRAMYGWMCDLSYAKGMDEMCALCTIQGLKTANGKHDTSDTIKLFYNGIGVCKPDGYVLTGCYADNINEAKEVVQHVFGAPTWGLKML